MTTWKHAFAYGCAASPIDGGGASRVARSFPSRSCPGDLIRDRANAFAFDSRSASWTSGSVSGTMSPTAIAVTIRRASDFDGLPCDTGPLSFVLDRHSDGTV